MAQWYDEITLDQIAGDAGVTVQTVIRRFGGKDGLLADAVQALGRQITASREAVPGDVPLLVRRLMDDYEQTGDPILRLLALEPRYPALSEFLDTGRRFHRDWISNLFEADLSRLDAASRKRALDALVIVTDVYTWKLLRRDMGRSVSATRETMAQLVEAAVSKFTDPNQVGDKK